MCVDNKLAIKTVIFCRNKIYPLPIFERAHLYLGRLVLILFLVHFLLKNCKTSKASITPGPSLLQFVQRNHMVQLFTNGSSTCARRHSWDFAHSVADVVNGFAISKKEVPVIIIITFSINLFTKVKKSYTKVKKK